MATPTHEPRAYVISTSSGALLIRQSAIPTVTTLNGVLPLRVSGKWLAGRIAASGAHRQALGMSDEEISARLQTLGQTTDQPLLGRLVKIDHDVPAEDQREAAGVRKWFDEIQTREFHPRSDLRLHPVPTLPLPWPRSRKRCIHTAGKSAKRSPG